MVISDAYYLQHNAHSVRRTRNNRPATHDRRFRPQLPIETEAWSADTGRMRVSVELIPRGEAELLADARAVRAAMPQASAFNIPDLMRFPLRSWEACKVTSSILPASIPHIRAIDLPPGDDVPMLEAVMAAGLVEVLVIRGDPPHDMSHRTYPNSSEDVIRRFKRRLPSLRVYAAFDPYRLGFRDEMTGVQRKLDAGADGFFTQPIFDVRLLEICAER